MEPDDKFNIADALAAFSAERNEDGYSSPFAVCDESCFGVSPEYYGNDDTDD